MSQELVLVRKRKYEDLLRRAGEYEHKDFKVQNTISEHSRSKDEMKPTSDELNEDETISEKNNQTGGGYDPYVQMTYDTFDKIQAKRRKTQAKTNAKTKNKWLTLFNL